MCGQGSIKNKCNKCATAIRYRATKHLIVHLKGGKCERCGYNKCIRALDFHHLRDKSFTISSAADSSGNIPKIIEEIKKCTMICSNCHRELHYNESKLNLNPYKEEIKRVVLMLKEKHVSLS